MDPAPLPMAAYRRRLQARNHDCLHRQRPRTLRAGCYHGGYALSAEAWRHQGILAICACGRVFMGWKRRDGNHRGRRRGGDAAGDCGRSGRWRALEAVALFSDESKASGSFGASHLSWRPDAVVYAEPTGSLPRLWGREERGRLPPLPGRRTGRGSASPPGSIRRRRRIDVGFDCRRRLSRCTGIQHRGLPCVPSIGDKEHEALN